MKGTTTSGISWGRSWVKGRKVKGWKNDQAKHGKREYSSLFFPFSFPFLHIVLLFCTIALTSNSYCFRHYPLFIPLSPYSYLSFVIILLFNPWSFISYLSFGITLFLFPWLAFFTISMPDIFFHFLWPFLSPLCHRLVVTYSLSYSSHFLVSVSFVFLLLSQLPLFIHLFVFDNLTSHPDYILFSNPSFDIFSFRFSSRSTLSCPLHIHFSYYPCPRIFLISFPLSLQSLFVTIFKTALLLSHPISTLSIPCFVLLSSSFPLLLLLPLHHLYSGGVKWQVLSHQKDAVA